MKAEVSYLKLQGRFGGKFIARRGARVLASARTCGALIRKVERKRLDRKQLSFGYVPPKDSLCIYAW